MDEKFRYKVFSNRENVLNKGQKYFLLKSLSNNKVKLKRILPIAKILDTGETYIIISPKIVGEHYTGGHWWDIVALLRECRAVGVALTNIHPDNFIVADGGLVFIDIGISVKPLDDNLWVQMGKRAYLSFKYPCRNDLKDLMTRSIAEDMPELKGVELLFHDIAGTSFDSPQLLSVEQNKPMLNVTLLIRTCYME